MVILHVAHMSCDPYAGVNVAVQGHIKTQQKLETVALLNIGDNYGASDIQHIFQQRQSHNISQLPEPFDHPDIAVFHEVYRPLFLLIAHEVKKLGVPYVVFPHGSLTNTAQSIKPLKKKIGNLLGFNMFINGASAIQCLSPREAEGTSFSPRKFIGTNGIRIPKVAAGKHNANGIQFVYIGRLDLMIKGLDLLMEAIYLQSAQLQKEGCHFDLYGPDIGGTLQKLTAMIQDFKISNIVKIHEPIDGINKERVLLKADYFIQSSRSEGMSMGILEALSYGVPCILTDGTGMAEWVTTYKAGYACKTSAQAIAEAISRAVDEISKRNDMVFNAARAVAENFSWDVVTQNILSTYRAIAENSVK